MDASNQFMEGQTGNSVKKIMKMMLDGAGIPITGFYLSYILQYSGRNYGFSGINILVC